MWGILRTFMVVLGVMIGSVIVILDYTPLFDAASAKISSQSSKQYVAQAQNGWEIEIEPGSHGHYQVDVDINGKTERFLVDTGASFVSFSLDTAERLGFYENSLEFNAQSRTANGLVQIALVTLDEVTIDDLTLRDVKAAIRRTSTGPSLLGMSFLSRLEGYEVRDGKLVFHW